MSKAGTRNKSTVQDGSQVLFERWKHRLLHGNQWFRLYWAGQLGVMWLSVIVLWVAYYVLQGHTVQGKHWLNMMVIGSVGIFTVIRLQLASLPYLIIQDDYSDESSEQLRSTPLSARDVFFKIFKLVALLCALPTAILLCVEVWALGAPVSSSSFNVYDVSIDAATMFWVALAAIGSGLIFPALGFLGSASTRKPFAAIVFPLIPVIILISVGFGLWILNETITAAGGIWDYVFDFMMLVVVPEGYLIQIFGEGGIVGPSMKFYSPATIALILDLTAIIVWGAGYVVFRKYWSARK